MSISKDIKLLTEIDNILKEVGDEDDIERILNYLVEKHCPYVIWSKRDLIRNIEYTLKNHSKVMVQDKQLETEFATIEGLDK